MAMNREPVHYLVCLVCCYINVMSYKWAKLGTISFSLLIRTLFRSFLHQYCLYATNFLVENVFHTFLISS